MSSSRRAASGSRSRPHSARPDAPYERGSRSGAGGRNRAGSGREGESWHGSDSPVVAVGQILLGVTLSCLGATIIFMVLVGVAAGLFYLAK